MSKSSNNKSGIIVAGVILLVLAVVGGFGLFLWGYGAGSANSGDSDVSSLGDPSYDSFLSLLQQFLNSLKNGYSYTPSQNNNSSNSSATADFYLTDQNGQKQGYVLPSGWELSSDQNYPSGEQSCISPTDFSILKECQVVVLYNTDYPDEYGYQVAFSTPGEFHWGGGSVPVVTASEYVTFLGESLKVRLNYQITQDSIPGDSNAKADKSNPANFAFCNADGICFSADFKNIPDSSDAYALSQDVRQLWRNIKVSADNSSNTASSTDFTLTSNDGKKYAFDIPSDWEVSKLDKYFPSNAYGCYYLNGKAGPHDCDIVVLAHKDFPDDYNYLVAFSMSGVVSWRGDEAEGMVGTTETINFLGKSINANLMYLITTDPTPVPSNFGFCNSQEICFSVDFNGIDNLDQKLEFYDQVKDLWKNTRAKSVN